MLTPNKALDKFAIWLLGHKFAFWIAVAVVAGGYLMDDYSLDISWLSAVQMGCSSVLSKAELIKAQVDRITVVEIDDDSFQEQFHSQIPTDRSALATLIGKIVQRQPAVIALDILLTKYTDEATREKANGELLKAVNDAINAGTSVVLARGLKDNGTVQEPNIFADADCRGARFGYVNLPKDRRRIPLEQRTETADVHQEPALARSFALETATAYRQRRGMERVEDSDSAVSDAISRSEFVFSGFRSRGDFPHVSARKILRSDPDELFKLDQKIVFIGSTWKGEDKNAIDSHLTPFGKMDGVYIHANYVEALLSGHVKKPAPVWGAVLFDLVASVLFIVASERWKTGWPRFILCVVFLLPILVSYVLFISIGYYLDFALPLIGLLFHGLSEFFKPEFIQRVTRRFFMKTAATTGICLLAGMLLLQPCFLSGSSLAQDKGSPERKAKTIEPPKPATAGTATATSVKRGRQRKSKLEDEKAASRKLPPMPK